MGNHTNFKGMFNKERIENLEKRVKELERKEDLSKLSENVISCRECLFRQKEFRKICPLMRCVDMSTGKCQTYKQVKL